VFFPFGALDGYIKEYLGSVRRTANKLAFFEHDAGKLISAAIRKALSSRAIDLFTPNIAQTTKEGDCRGHPL
jgi:hypothetical protein